MDNGSGLSIRTITYFNENGTSISLSSDPADPAVASWQIEMNGQMNANGGEFEISYDMVVQ